MSDQQIDVRIRAQTSDLKRGMDDAARNVQQASGRMREAVQNAAERMKAAFAGMRQEIDKVRSLRVGDEASANSMTDAVSRLRGGVTALAAGYLGIQGIQAFVKTSDEVLLLNARLKQVTGSIEAARDAQKGLYEMAQRLQVPYTELVSTFARLMPAVKELGGGVREATALSEILVSTARLSGASAAEAAASAMQFAQALGSGTLQGDELRSILENNATLARTLAGSLGLTIGELRKWGEEGKLTSDLVGNALLGQVDNIKSQTADLPVTVGGAWTRVSNAFTRMVESFNEGTGAIQYLVQLFEGLGKLLTAVTESFIDPAPMNFTQAA